VTIKKRVTKDDYTMLIARLGACLIKSPQHGDTCARGWCFGTNDCLALQILFEVLDLDQYRNLHGVLEEILDSENGYDGDDLRLPQYGSKEPCIDNCFPASFLFRALAKVLVIEG